ncbi:winged helix DNA-binding domain-containing protein [Ceratobasidium sp. AG-I]|nr:winged helix DNA-binding domain-containing protein [Ceratobasidium sp. AG-I]
MANQRFIQDSRSYAPDPALAYSTSWPPYDSSSVLAAGADPVNLTLPGPSSDFQFYPSAFGTSPFQLPDTTYPTPPPTGSVAFESTFQHEFFAQPPPVDAPNPFLIDTPKLRSEGVSTNARQSSLAIRSRATSQPQLRTQLSIPSPFPAYRSIQSFPVNLHRNQYASSSSPTDDVQPSIRRLSNDQVNKSASTLSEVIVPTEEESTAFISKLYHILSRPEYSKYLAWNESGDAFLLMNATEFAQQVLPRFFRHSNISSFVRQLRLYGFTRVSTIRLLQLADQSDHPAAADLVAQANASPSFQSASGFAHPLFLRGGKNLLGQLKPRSSRKAKRAASIPKKEEETDGLHALAGSSDS